MVEWGTQQRSGHGGPPLHLLQGYQVTLGVNVGVALRGHPFEEN